MRYDELVDVVIDFGLTELRNVGGEVFICDESVQRLILGIYENMEYLYDVIAGDEMLREVFMLPMGCIVEYKGFACLVRAKIDPKS